MNWLDGAIIGLIQGLTEFLPVSSSGHLALARAVLGYDPPGGAMVEVLMHLGTALSIMVVFSRDVGPLLRAGLLLLQPWCWREVRASRKDAPTTVVLIMVSTIPVGVLGVLFKSDVEALFDDTVFVGAMLICTGAMLFLLRFLKQEGGRDVVLGVAVLMGVAQACAILPGVSRSGATITAGLLAGASRESVGRFAFLMGLPPILGAAALKLREVSGAGVEWGPVLLGTLVAFAVGVLALRLLLRFVARGRMYVFAPYCVMVGVFAVFA